MKGLVPVRTTHIFKGLRIRICVERALG